MNLGINSSSKSSISTGEINDRIDAAVDTAARSGTFPATIQEAAGPIQIACELLAVESIACAFERLEVVDERWKTAPLAQVKKVAEALAGRLTYLLEPIRTIETDADACLVQMRSLPPRKAEDGSRTYYELQVMGGGKLSLCRFAKQPEQPRQAVPIQVTREVFRRLTSDFVEAAG